MKSLNVKLVGVSRLILVWGICSFILISCKKKIIDEYAVYQYQDISIPNIDSIISVSFPSKEYGFVVCKEGTYKTNDAGKNWVKVSEINTGEISFYDEEFGVNSNRSYTFDGGNTWNSFYYLNKLSMTKEGNMIGLEETSWNQVTLIIYEEKSDQVSKTFSIPFIYYDIEKIKCTGDYIIIIPNDYAAEDILVVNYKSEDSFRIQGDWTNFEKPTDFLIMDRTVYACGKQGFIAEGSVPEGEFGYISRFYYQHTNPFIAIDAYENTIIAVGNRTISTNKSLLSNNNEFKEVLKEDLKSFGQNFSLIEFVDNECIIVVSSNGEILMGQI